MISRSSHSCILPGLLLAPAGALDLIAGPASSDEQCSGRATAGKPTGGPPVLGGGGVATVTESGTLVARMLDIIPGFRGTQAQSRGTSAASQSNPSSAAWPGAAVLEFRLRPVRGDAKARTSYSKPVSNHRMTTLRTASMR